MKTCDFRQEEEDFALIGKLGIKQFQVQTMSGGEETRLKIAQALSKQVYGILADEPTSHLDREGIDFLIGQYILFWLADSLPMKSIKTFLLNMGGIQLNLSRNVLVMKK